MDLVPRTGPLTVNSQEISVSSLHQVHVNSSENAKASSVSEAGFKFNLTQCLIYIVESWHNLMEINTRGWILKRQLNLSAVKVFKFSLDLLWVCLGRENAQKFHWVSHPPKMSESREWNNSRLFGHYANSAIQPNKI